MGMFYNPGNTVKGIAKFGFWFCLLIAVIAFSAGIALLSSVITSNDHLSWYIVLTKEISSLSVYVWGMQVYFGKILCTIALYATLACIGSIPLYAFGSLVEDIATIKSSLQQDEEQ